METNHQPDPIEVHDLHKSFSSQTVLDGLGLQVHEGETLAVLGRSGTGKSVLLKLLIGLDKPDSGTVCIEGQSINEAAPAKLNEIRKHIGFLFQQAALYDSMTLEENVMFPMGRHGGGKTEEQKRRAGELLKSVGISAGLDKLPSQISGGMQKRVGLARALALDPKILLFDEPTAGLDPITAAEIGKLIKDLQEQRGLTSVVVTHDIRGARAFADRLVLMREGKIVAEGSYEDLRKSDDDFVKQFFSDS